MHDVTDPKQTDAAIESEDLIEADSLIEEVSIDGMCGVY
jgi:mycofactocin precursor